MRMQVQIRIILVCFGFQLGRVNSEISRCNFQQSLTKKALQYSSIGLSLAQFRRAGPELRERMPWSLNASCAPPMTWASRTDCDSCCANSASVDQSPRRARRVSRFNTKSWRGTGLGSSSGSILILGPSPPCCGSVAATPLSSF